MLIKGKTMTDILSLKTIQINATVRSKEDAIRMAGALLVTANYVHPDYVKGMLQREQIMSTFAGNGVSIPHGQFDDISLVNQTGISVLQIPEGVEWEDGEKVYLVVGIAAKGEEHIQVLANLAEVLEDIDTARMLASTDNPNVILEYLNNPVKQEE
jgi:mannitol PTS system EIIA component